MSILVGQQVITMSQGGLVPLQGGAFTMGIQSSDGWTQKTTVEPFQISGSPVTNAEYETYLEVNRAHPLALFRVHEGKRVKVAARGNNERELLHWIRSKNKHSSVFGLVNDLTVKLIDEGNSKSQKKLGIPPYIKGAYLLFRAGPEILKDAGQDIHLSAPAKQPPPLLQETLPKTSAIYDRSKEPDEPAVFVNWFEALAYCAAVGGRLPADEEWEFAAQGPEASAYGKNGEKQSADFIPLNDYTLRFLPGKIWEWISDEDIERKKTNFHKLTFNYLRENDPNAEPEFHLPKNITLRMLRGGSWMFDGLPHYLRASHHIGLSPFSRSKIFSFRVVAPNKKQGGIS